MSSDRNSGATWRRVLTVAILAAGVMALTVGPALATGGDRYEPNNLYFTATQVEPPWASSNAGSEFDLEISNWLDEDYFSFYAEEGDSIRVTLEAPDDAELDLEVLDSNRHSQKSTSTLWGSASISVTASVTGTHYVHVEKGLWGKVPILYRLEISSPYHPGGGTSALFSDVPEWYWYAVQINDMATRGVVEGYGDGRFGPLELVKRQQFAKMVVLAMGYPVSEANVCPFDDVDKPSDNPYPDNYIAVAAERGITVGVAPGKFAPWDSISRAQLVTMVARAADLGDPPADYTPAFGNFSDTHYPWARRAAYAGLLSELVGMGPDYDFWAPATRAEVCVVLYNLLHR